jgi:hypothetical protein
VILVDASRGVPKAGVCTEPLARDYATLPFGLLKRAIWPQMKDQLPLLHVSSVYLPVESDFMRVFSERVYGIPPEQIVGSSGKLMFELREGKPVLVKLPELDFNDDQTGKAVEIQLHIGRRPIFAFGNSDGDLAMLEWTEAGSGACFMGLVHHTDGEREWAYDRDSSSGRLDKGLAEAQARGWTLVDMKNEWKNVFPFK